MRKNRIRVLTIVNSLNVGGVEKTLLSCVKSFDTERVEIIICCFKTGGKLELEYKKLGVKIVKIKKTGLILVDFLQLLILFLNIKIDVVHSRMGYTSGGFVMAAKVAKKKSVVSFHSSYPSALKRFKNNKCALFLLSFHLKVHKFIIQNLADCIVGHSKANLDANFSEWRNNAKFNLIYNGIDFKNLKAEEHKSLFLDSFIEENSFVLLHIGSMRPEKNHFFMMDCLNELNKGKSSYKLILVGDGKLFNSVKDYVNKLGQNGVVHFVGNEINLRSYFENADLFFFPSTNEGFGNVIVEAQYMNLPVCCSNINPLLESSFKGYHKFMFNPNEVTSAVKSILEMEHNIKEIKKIIVPKAHDYVYSHFSLSNMVNELTNMYNSLFIHN